MYDLSTQVTGTAQNIYAATVELATFVASADCIVSPAVRLSSLTGTAANLTIGYRHTTSGGTAIGEWVEQFAKPQAASTVATSQLPLVRLDTGEKLVVTAKSSNSSDTAAAFAIDWPGELLAVVTVPSAADNATEIASVLATAHGAGSWLTATSVTVSDKTGFKLASDGLATVAAWTVNVTGNLSGSVGSVVGHTPQTGDTYALAAGASGFAAIKADTAAIAAYGTGDGDTAVDHNTGGTDALLYSYGGTGIDNGTIRAYLKSDYDAGTYTLRGQTVTGSDGRWAKPMYLNSGLTYTLTFEKPGAYGVTEQEVTIP
jgi:hypothetical protein